MENGKIKSYLYYNSSSIRLPQDKVVLLKKFIKEEIYNNRESDYFIDGFFIGKSISFELPK